MTTLSDLERRLSEAEAEIRRLKAREADSRELRKDLSDLRERMTRYEVRPAGRP